MKKRQQKLLSFDRLTLVGESPGLGFPSHCIVKVLGELAPLVGLELDTALKRSSGVICCHLGGESAPFGESGLPDPFVRRLGAGRLCRSGLFRIWSL